MIEYGHINVKSPFQMSFIPSLHNISKIGSPSEIIEIFSDVYAIHEIEYLKSFNRHSKEVSNYVLEKAESKALEAAVHVLNCCCDKDPSELIGMYLDDEYISAAESKHNIIELAKILLKNGVCGKSTRKSTNENSKKLSKFNAIEYINMARTNLKKGLEESKSMTMTELIMLMESEYPEQEDANKKPKFNLDKSEYDKKMKAAKELRDKIIKQRGKR